MSSIYKKAVLGEPIAQFELAKSLIYKDKQKALFWFEKSAQNGNADSLCACGLFHFFGQAVKQDKALAKKLWQEAAHKNSLCALYALNKYFGIK